MMPRRLLSRRALIPLAVLLLAGAGSAAAEDHMNMNMNGMDMGVRPAHDHPGASGFGQPARDSQATRTVKIVMDDTSFTPGHLEVKQGEVVRFVVTNTGGIDHEFMLGDPATQTAHRQAMAQAMQAGAAAHHHGGSNVITVRPGETQKLSWLFSKAGSVDYDCNIPGHFEVGMHGTVTVSP